MAMQQNILPLLYKADDTPIADISKLLPILCQVDVEANFIIADRFANRCLIAHVNQPSSQWGVVDLPDLPDGVGCCGAVWFRHGLHVADHFGRLFTFTHKDAQSPTHLQS